VSPFSPRSLLVATGHPLPCELFGFFLGASSGYLPQLQDPGEARAQFMDMPRRCNLAFSQARAEPEGISPTHSVAFIGIEVNYIPFIPVVAGKKNELVP
jgi:hypothetical protein